MTPPPLRASRGRQPPGPRAPRPPRIALFLPNWVGDAVMATPAVRAVRDIYPAARVVAVCRPFCRDLFAGAPWFDDLVVAGRSAADLAALTLRLRRERIDIAVLFPNSARPALAAALGGCRRRVGYARYLRGPLLTDALPPPAGPSPALDAYNRLAERLGARPTARLELFTTPADEGRADALWRRLGLAGRTVVGFNTGGAFGPAKNWPEDHFAELARQLADRRGCGVLVLCGPAERDAARRIAALAGRSRVVSAADAELSLGLTKACVRRCHLLVTTDSGPRHFAAAFGRPVVTLFGPTHVGWTETYHPRAVHLQKSVPCGPCQRRVCPTGDHRCMTTLTPDEVFEAAAALLAREVRRAG